MIKLSHNLPDDFVERVRTLEVKLDIAIQENKELISTIKQIREENTFAIKQHRKETFRLRQVIQFLSGIPGGAKSLLVGILAIVFINSLAVEILLKTTNFHVKIKRQIVDFLATDK